MLNWSNYIILFISIFSISYIVTDGAFDDVPQTVAQEAQPAVQLQAEAMDELAQAITSLAQAVTELSQEQGDALARAKTQSNAYSALEQARSAQLKSQLALTLVQAKANPAQARQRPQDQAQATQANS